MRNLVLKVIGVLTALGVIGILKILVTFPVVLLLVWAVEQIVGTPLLNMWQCLIASAVLVLLKMIV